MKSSAPPCRPRRRAVSSLRCRCACAAAGGCQRPLRWKRHPDSPTASISAAISRPAVASVSGSAACAGTAWRIATSSTPATQAMARTAASARPLRQPVVDRGGHFPGPAGDVDADMTAAERQLGVIVGADHVAQRARGIGRHQVVLLGEDVEHRHVDEAQVDLASADLDAAVEEAVALVELLDELAEGL